MIAIHGETLIVEGVPARFEVAEYFQNGRPAIQIVLEGGEPWGSLTVNLPGEGLEDGEFFVRAWGEGEGLARAALETGLFLDTGRRVRTGFVEASVWRLASKSSSF